MDPRFETLRRPRHLLATGLVFLLLGGAGGALVGLAAADDEDQPSVALGLPHVGDAGVYELRKAPLDDDAVHRGFTEDRELRIAFAFGAPSVRHDAEGRGHWTQQVDLHRHTERGDSNETLFVDRSWAAIASVREVTLAQPPRQDDGLLPTEESASTVWRTTWFGAWSLLPCGLLDSFQGQVLEPGGYLRSTDSCEWGASDYDPNGHWRRVRGVIEDEGLLVVDHAALHPDDRPNRWTRPDWRAWYSPASPYPVRMQDLLGGAFGAPGDILELTHLTRGTDPLTWGHAATDLPALRLSQRPAWTLDDGDAEHPWPLSAAYAHALSDPDSGLGDFMAQHPDAYLAHAAHAAFDVDGQHTERWSFTATDGQARHSVTIAQDLAPRQVLGVPVGPPLTTIRYEDPWTAPVDDVNLPAPHQLPARLPTAASLLAQWRVAMGDTANPDASPSWSFLLSCDDPCTNVTTHLRAGQVYAYREAEPGYPILDNRVDAWDTSELAWQDGALSHGSESLQVHNTETTGPLDLATPREPAPDAAFAAGTLPDVWAWPSPAQAASVGLAALLGAALYYLWPLLKTGGLGLFTRLQSSELLEHKERRAIHEALAAEPGLHFNELRRRVGLGNGALNHHLAQLEKADLVTSARSAGYTCFYLKGQMDRRVMAALPALRSDGARRVFQAVVARPGIAGAEAAAAAGLTPQTGHYHIQRLRAAGLVDARRDGRAVRLHPTDVAGRVPATGSAGA